MKLRLKRSGFDRPMFSCHEHDRLRSSYADTCARLVEDRLACVAADTDNHTGDLAHHSQSPADKTKDSVTYAFSQPRISSDITTNQDLYLPVTRQDILKSYSPTNRLRMDGFAKYNEERAKYKSTLRR